MKKKQVVIFGVGISGRAVYRKLQKQLDQYEIVAFIDNDKSKDGQEFGSVEIHAPNALKFLKFDMVVLSGRFVKEQKEQLIKDLNIPESDLWFMKRSEVIPSESDRKNRTQSIDKILSIFLTIVKEKNINYWMDHSSLLALHRNEDFSKFSDVDVTLVTETEAYSLWNSLIESKLANEFEIFKFHTKQGEPNAKYMPVGSMRKILIKSKVSIADEEPALFELSIKTLVGERYIYTVNGLEAFIPRKYFQGFEIMTYKSLNLRVPVDSRSYLSLIYGSDWIEPDEFWSDSKLNNTLSFIH